MLFGALFYASYAFGAVFVICELCQRITNSFDEISEKIEAFEWNSFPQEIQKLLPILLIGAQQPVVFECFGGISALRETFKKVSELRNRIQSFLDYHKIS